MSEKARINLYNRYGDKVWLEHLEENKWQLKGDDLSYMRIIFEKEIDGPIKAVDPSGGPFLSVGDKVDGREITSIINNKPGFILTLSNENKEN